MKIRIFSHIRPKVLVFTPHFHHWSSWVFKINLIQNSLYYYRTYSNYYILLLFIHFLYQFLNICCKAPFFDIFIIKFFRLVAIFILVLHLHHLIWSIYRFPSTFLMVQLIIFRGELKVIKVLWINPLRLSRQICKLINIKLLLIGILWLTLCLFILNRLSRTYTKLHFFEFKFLFIFFEFYIIIDF